MPRSKKLHSSDVIALDDREDPRMPDEAMKEITKSFRIPLHDGAKPIDSACPVCGSASFVGAVCPVDGFLVGSK